MVADPIRSLLERRLVIVTGKGGTGKTTVAATLALAAHGAGLKVLVLEVGPDEHLPKLISPGGAPVGYEGRDLLPGLRAMRIDPFEALAEYLSLQVGVRALVDVLMRNKGFGQLLNAAPGWRELITLGKVWHLEQFEEEGIPLYDLIVVDAPATGHGVTFLDVPRVVGTAVRAGPLRRHAGLVEAMIRDRRRTMLLPVSLAEELPVRETAELVVRARDEVGIAIDRVVVNGVLSAPFPEGLEHLDQLLQRLPGDAAVSDFASARELAFCASYLASRYRLNQVYSKEVAASTGLPTVALPYLPMGVRGPDDLKILASGLLADPTAAPAA
jgi:anion-transporting  ArsA/GET3 family ATPase